MQKNLALILTMILAFSTASMEAQQTKSPVIRFEAMEKINSDRYEYAQGLIGENILFVKAADQGIQKDKLTNDFYFNLYQWDENENKSVPLPDLVNSKLHEGSAVWCEGTQELIFSRNRNSSNREKNDRAGIYIWKNGSDTLLTFPYNKEGHILCHPSISADGSIMVFSADFQEGFGGMDLYYTVRNDDGWSEPVNLGEAINTSGNEVFPFIHRSETLFYSSSGMEGKGGLDLYYSTPLSGVWQRPDALPEPFNSEADDFAFWMNPLGTHGFMNSNRQGGNGSDDIYQYTTDQPVFIPAKETHTVEVISEKTGKPLKDATVTLQFNQAWNYPYKKQKNAVPEAEKPWQQSHFTTDIDGQVLISVYEDLWLQVIVDHPDHMKTTEILKFDEEQLWHQIVLKGKCAPYNGVILSELDETPVGGVKTYLTSSDGVVKDSVFSNEKGFFSYSLTQGESYQLTFKKTAWKTMMSEPWTASGFPDSKVWRMIPEETGKEITLLPEGPFEKGSVFVFDQIYYDYNDSKIREDATAELDALIRKMKEQPGMRIELIAHTDSRGNAEYNLLLSVARAEAAKSYLVQNGINGKRILAVGYGEHNLRNHCSDDVDCTEEEHAYNRRTEIRILSN